MKKFSLVGIPPSYAGITGPWSLLGDNYQYYQTDTKVDVNRKSIAVEVHNSSICIGPDGQPWTAHIELEAVPGGGGDAPHGVFVYRWNGTTWVQVSYSGTTDGAVSDTNRNVLFMSYWSKGGVVNSAGLGPQICCDGTNIYIVHCGGNGYSTFTVCVWKYDGSTWTLLTHSAVLPVTDYNFISLACSSADVGHPVIAYRTSATVAYIDRWNGSSWDHLGGSNLALNTGESYINTQEYSLVLDNAARPHFVNSPYGYSQSVPVGQALFMRSWTGSAWVSVPFNQINLGITSDYRSSGNEAIGNPKLSPLISTYGTLGKIQAAFSLNKYTKTTGLEMKDQGTGYGLYVVEYDCDARAWIPLNGNPKYGHVSTYNTTRDGGVKAISTTGMYYPYSLALPDTTKNLSILCAKFYPGDEPKILFFDVSCAKWRVASLWYFNNLSSQGYSNAFRIQTDPSTAANGSAYIMRVGNDIYLPVRWWNGKTAHYQRWNDFSGGDMGNVRETGGENATGTVSGNNAHSSTLAYNASTSPTTGGRGYAESSMFAENDNNYTNMNIRVRVMLKGSSGNGDIAFFLATVFKGYLRITSADGYNVWLTKDIVTNVPFTNDQQLEIRWGINGGSTSFLLDWMEIYPTDSTLVTEMRTYVYKGTITPNLLVCP